MSRMVTRPELRTMALRRADVEAETDETNGRFPLSEVNEEINRSLASYHTLLVSLRGADYFEKRYTLLDTIVKSNAPGPSLSLLGVPAYDMTPLVLTVSTAGVGGVAQFDVAVNGAYLVTVQSGGGLTEVEIPGTGLRLQTTNAASYTISSTFTTKTVQWKTAPNVSTYVLPEDFFQLTMVEALISGVHVPIEKFNRNQRPWLRDVATWYGYDSLPNYRLRGDGRYKNTQLIEFAPTPSQVYEVDIWYIPQPAKYNADDGQLKNGIWELPFDSGGEEWVACDVAQKLLLKDNLDPSFLLHRKQQIEEAIKLVFSARDTAMPERIVDRSESFGLGPWPWR